MKYFKFFLKKIIYLIREKFGVNQILISQGLVWCKLIDFSKEYKNLYEFEFKVFSQRGEDGIIQFLVANVDIPKESKVFVEFGVENYLESNTRFLLIKDNWSGLVIDGSKYHTDFIKSDYISNQYDLKIENSFITKDNINSIFTNNGIVGEIGLLSIDIDGNDYWVWEAITSIKPIITVVEYNSCFGKDRAITIPYKSDFYRTSAHHSNLYFGASLKALCLLAEKKGYTFVGSNSTGTNSFFVRSDKMGRLKPLYCQNEFVESKFSEVRNKKGELQHNISWEKRVNMLKDMEVIDIEVNELIKL